MLASIGIVLGAFVLGFLWFWAFPIWAKKVGGLGPNVLTSKYLGFKSYELMRSHVIGLNMLGGPIAAVIALCIATRLGWPDALFVVAFPVGYLLAFWRFLAKPKKAWEDEKLPTSDF